jgi:hypothetical protein
MFLRHDLLTVTDVDAADVHLAHAELVQWKSEWFELQIEQNRIVFATTQQPFVRLRDLVVRLFKEAAPDSPLAMLGINRDVHFKVASTDIRDRIGKALAPWDVWGDWAQKLEGTDAKKHGGLTNLQMVQRDLDDGRPSGHVQVTVQPSVRVKLPAVGIYVQVNDHYEIADTSKPKDSQEVVEFLAANFDKAVERADALIERVMSLKDK